METDFFDIVTGVLQKHSFAPYLFIFYRDYVLWTLIDLMKENGPRIKKARNRRYFARTITDADYEVDLAPLANTPVQEKSLLHSLEWSTGGISFHMVADKIMYLCFNESSDISTLNGGSLKLVYKFTYLGSCVTSTENDFKTWLTKA